MTAFNLESYLTKGVENIVKGIWKASLKNPVASVYMLQYLNANKEANARRKKAE